MNHSVQQKFLSALKSSGIKPNTPLLAAYSGGLDSHVLLHLLACSEYKNLLTAVHVNHGLMDDADNWSAHCQQVCDELDIPVHSEKVIVNKQHSQGLEAAAREVRYQALVKHVQENGVLLTAHHQDDQAETMLLQLLRGTGVPGLAAMAKVSHFKNVKLVRPLLEFSRKELEDYARNSDLQWIEDQSNQDTKFDRNYLRQNVLPVIKEKWPAANKQLSRSASHQAEASELLKRLAEQDLTVCQSSDSSSLELEKLLLLDNLSLKNALRYFINEKSLLAPSERQLRHILHQIRQPSVSGQHQINWSGGVVRVYRGTLSVCQTQEPVNLATQLLWEGLAEDNDQLELPGSGYTVSTSKVTGSGLSIKQLQKAPVTLRFRQGGESCLLPDRGHHHKLKKLFQEAGIPPWERARLPLIYVGEELAAVADKWVCAPFHAQKNEAGISIRINPAPE